MLLNLEEFKDLRFSDLLPKKKSLDDISNDRQAKTRAASAEDFEKSQLFFVRKAIATYVETLDKGLGTMGMDYGLILDNFSAMLKKIRIIYPSLQVQILYGYSALIKSSHRRFSQLGTQEFSHLISAYLETLGINMTQNLQFYKGNTNVLIELSADQLNLSRNVQLLLRNQILIRKYLQEPSG